MARKTNPTAYGKRIDAKFEAQKNTAGKVMGLGLSTMGISAAGGVAGAPATGGLSLAPAAFGVGLGGLITRAGRSMLHQAHSERVRGRAIQDLAARGKRSQEFESANQKYEHDHMQSHAAEPSTGGGGTVTVHEHQRRAPARRGD